jgi:nucleoside-diphosphate-sugar epimerase
MRIFLTGATGFIGSHLAEALHAKGHQLRCLVRKTSNLEWIKHLPIEYVYGDLFDQDLLLRSVKDVDFIYHLAGVTKAKTREEYLLGNHIATKNILDAVILVKPPLKRFVHVSSQAAVGPSGDGVPVDEETPFHPITTYGVSKMEAELECLKLRDAIPITITRPPAVYGPRDKDVFEFFNAMNKGLHAMIGFNNKQVSLIHVADLVSGIILAGEHPQAVGRTYFISSERFYNWKEVGALTSKIMDKKVLRVRIPEFAVYAIAAVAQALSTFSNKPALLNLEKARDIVQDNWTCSIDRARRELGYQEKLSLERGIAETVDWYRQHHWF